MNQLYFQIIEYTTQGWGRNTEKFNTLEEAIAWITQDQDGRDPNLEVNYSVVPSGIPVFETTFEYNE